MTRIIVRKMRDDDLPAVSELAILANRVRIGHDAIILKRVLRK
jgi:hypothetical protein